MRLINEITVHCSATRADWMQGKPTSEKVAELKRWHLQRGFADVGYHYIIDRDGTVQKGRPVVTVGAHEPKVNATSIGICLLGGFGSNANDAFDQNYTIEQDAALRDLIDNLKQEYPKIKKVTGHNDYANKACPGFRVSRWLDGKPAQRSLGESKTMTGAALAGTGTTGVVVVQEIANAVQTAQYTIEPIAEAIPWLRYISIALTMIGLGLVVYAKLKDWKGG